MMIFVAVFYIALIIVLKVSRKYFIAKVKKEFQNQLQENENIEYITDYHFGILESSALIPALSLFAVFEFFKINIFLSILFLFPFIVALYYIKDYPKYNIFIITNKNIYPSFYNKKLYDRMQHNYEIMRFGFCETISFEEIEIVKPALLNICIYGVEITLKNNKKNINGLLTNKNKEIANFINSKIVSQK